MRNRERRQRILWCLSVRDVSTTFRDVYREIEESCRGSSSRKDLMPCLLPCENKQGKHDRIAHIEFFYSAAGPGRTVGVVPRKAIAFETVMNISDLITSTVGLRTFGFQLPTYRAPLPFWPSEKHAVSFTFSVEFVAPVSE